MATDRESASEEKKKEQKKKKEHKKVGKPIGDPVGGRDAPNILDIYPRVHCSLREGWRCVWGSRLVLQKDGSRQPWYVDHF